MAGLYVLYLHDDRRGAIMSSWALTRQEAQQSLRWMYQGFSPPERFAIATPHPTTACVMVTDSGERITCDRGPYTKAGWEEKRASLWPFAFDAV